MKRVFSLAMILALLLCACAGGGEAPAGDQTAPPEEPAFQGDQKSLREHGMDVIALMDEMARSEQVSIFGGIFGSSSGIAAAAEAIAAGDYSAPKKVYEVTYPSLEEYLVHDGLYDAESYPDGDGLLDGLSEAVLECLTHKIPSVVINHYNAAEGSSRLAAVSMLSVSKLFVSSELAEDTVYIYTFQEGYPVAVVFTTGEDGAVCATGTFILSDSFSVTTLEIMQDLTDGLITIREVED